LIKLEPTKDSQLIKTVLSDPELWERISEDGQKPEHMKISVFDPHYWFRVMIDNEVAALVLFTQKGLHTINIHINVLKKYRKKYAKPIGKEIIRFFAEDAPKAWQKMNAEIPVIFHDVYQFSLNCGLTQEGINRSSTLKNGEMMNQYYLGITRKEAACLL